MKLPEKRQFYIELFLALFLTALATAAAFSNLLFTPNDVYPVTADAMGHMTKVKFLADSFSRGEFPPWFPSWYNGATTAQYYPPLSYLMMAPIQMLTQNVMITYKIFCFFVLYVGGLGTWFFCRRHIGHWCGLFGGVLYSIQPFLTRMLFDAGVMAQAPVYALTPWFLLALFECAKKPTRKNFLLSAFGTGLCILGHAMHAYIICFCFMIVLFYFVFTKKITFQNFFFTGLSIVFGALITGFWWLVGATGFETPGIPYLIDEPIISHTATWDWYLKGNSVSGLLLPLSIPITSILALILYFVLKKKKKNTGKEEFLLLFHILLTAFTIFFSFGRYNPLFRFVPLHATIMPGRILSVAGFTGAVVCAYLLWFLGKQIVLTAKWKRAGCVLCSIFLICGVILQMNPLGEYHQVMDVNEEYITAMEEIDNGKSAFNKGRYEWLGAVNCVETYFPLLYDFNTCDGWNIEGTPHNRAIWNHNIALAVKKYDYVIKNMAWWNVRYLNLFDRYTDMLDELETQGFFLAAPRKYGYNVYASNLPSSYFMTDNRNGLLLGDGALGVTMEFPFLIYDQRADLSEYTLDELMKYRFIYLCEPDITSETQQKTLEDRVTALTKAGVQVLIEPKANGHFKLFDVSTKEVRMESTPVVSMTAKNPYDGSLEILSKDLEENVFVRVLFGLSESYCTLTQNNGRLVNDLLGVKEIDGGQVIFIGAHMSQYLSAVYARNWGTAVSLANPPASSEVIFSYLAAIFKAEDVSSNYLPSAFPVKSSSWDYQGGTFTYHSDTAQEVIVSVTYTPRWEVTIDGQAQTVFQTENLVNIKLPAGDHTVSLTYGVTKYGIAGYAVSLFGILMLCLFIIFFHKVYQIMNHLFFSIQKYLQLQWKTGRHIK